MSPPAPPKGNIVCPFITLFFAWILLYVYGVLHTWLAQTQSEIFHSDRPVRAPTLEYLFSSTAWNHEKLSIPRHLSHYGECRGMLSFSWFQAVLEKRYSQVLHTCSLPTPTRRRLEDHLRTGAYEGVRHGSRAAHHRYGYPELGMPAPARVK